VHINICLHYFLCGAVGVFWCAGVIWFRVFMCSEKPNYASTPEHTNGATKKNSSDKCCKFVRCYSDV